MEIETLSIQHDKIETIYHVADIHIRNVKRHDEYREVFDRFFKDIEQRGQKNSIIFIAGDIAHSKVEMSPELIKEMSDFLSRCADFTDTLIIPGNHDCFTGDQEVLTRVGWQRISDIVEGDQNIDVCCFDSETCELNFDQPIAKIKKPFSGDLIHFTGKDVDLKVTPTHEILYQFSGYNTQFSKKMAKDLPKQAHIPINGVITDFENDTFFNLLGFSFADGTFVLKNERTGTCRIQFRLKKQRKKDYLSKLLDDLGYEYNWRHGTDGVSTVCIYSDLARKIYSFFNGQKSIPFDLLSESRSKIKSFVDGYFEGDGWVIKNSVHGFCSIDRQSIEVLQTAMRFIGGTSHSDLEPFLNGAFENSKPQYGCNCNLNNKVNRTKVQSRENIPFTGDVYCLTVPTSNLLIRRNNKIFITGNCNLNNKTRLDVITPVVKNLSHPHLHHLDKNSLYKCKNLLISHYLISEDSENFITCDKIPSTYKNKSDTLVSTWHGPMNQAKTDIGYEVSNKAITKDLFKGFDIALLGDIHMYQCLQKFDSVEELPEIVYPGSMVQQNHGEAFDGHGYCVWDVKSRNHEHVELKNDYGYFTVNIRDGDIEGDLSELPPKARLRIRCFETEPAEVKKALAKIQKLSDLQEVSYIRGDAIKDLKRGNVSKVPLVRLNDVNFQNTLIENFLRRKNPKIKKKSLDLIFEINRNLNSRLSQDDKVPNIQWVPKTFKFDNMFSYGEGNVIDFTKLNGINGIFAGNASGKSSLMDAFCFCLWDKCSRTFKAANVMNESKMGFKCEVEFEIDGVSYFVKRAAKRNKKGDVRVEVDFYKMVNGEKENLNDESRRSTNDIIRSYIGSYEDFILTALSLQRNNSNFIDKGQSERKDLIARFLGITIFDHLSQQAQEESRDISAFIRKHDRKKILTKTSSLDDQIFIAEEKYNKMLDIKGEIVTHRESLLKQIVEKNSEIVNLANVPDNIDDFEIELQQKEKLSSAINIDALKSECDVFTTTIKQIKQNILDFEDSNIEKQKDEFDETTKNLNSLNSEIEILKVEVRNKLDKVAFLDTHEYDPECEYCNKNAFVQDAIQSKTDLETLKPNVVDKMKQKNKLVEMLETLDDIPEKYDQYKNLQTKLSKIESEYHKCINSVQEKEKELINLNNEIDNLKKKIKRFNDSIDIIKKNEKVKNEILQLNDQLEKFSGKLKIADEKIMETNSQINVWKNDLKNFNDLLVELDELEEQNHAYQLYYSSVSRDGVPYDIICKSIPSIESEINEILSQLVEFGISIEMDGKNVNASIVYDEKCWPIELTSGMETFISNLAIRIALTNISNMPKTTFLMIDEGFGALDSEVMASLHQLFTFLKVNYDFIMVISHIDTLRDVVDGHIEIQKEKGFSNVIFD